MELLNSWASTTTAIIGNSNKSLAAGIYGYQFAIAGEILRTYDGWAPEDFKKYQDWMLNLWYPENKSFLEYHHGANDLHYWANWGLCNVASTMAIGILTDRRDIYNEGVTHFQIGKLTEDSQEPFIMIFLVLIMHSCRKVVVTRDIL